MKEILKENNTNIGVVPVKFCREPSEHYLKLLDECGDDPRSVAGQYAINKAGGRLEKGWIPTWDARDSRDNYSYNREMSKTARSDHTMQPGVEYSLR